MSEYSYDEQGDVWPYFVIAILSVILLPLTISLISFPNTSKPVEGSINENSVSLGLPVTKKSSKSKLFNTKLVVIIVGWAIVIYVSLNLTKSADVSTIFDPYEILGISSSASEKQIKSHYRKLSLTYHPDKIPKEIGEVEREVMEQAFVRLNKAYKALTDEVTRENFLKFGHPDGRQEVTNGIALPSFLVGEYSLYVMVIYLLSIIIVLPLVVGSWWNNVKSYTTHGLHINSASLFTRFLSDRNPGKVIAPIDLLELFSKTFEVESLKLSKTEYNESLDNYLNRRGNFHPELIELLPDLIFKFIEMAVVFRNHDIVVTALDLQKSIVQAVKLTGKYQDILQLPYVDPKVVEGQSVKKLGKLFTLTNEEIKTALGIKDDNKLIKTLDIASKITSLRVVYAGFKVPGETIVTPNSKAHLNLKFLVKSPRLKSCPNLSGAELEDEFETNMEYLKDPTIVNTKQPQLPISYSPYYPGSLRNKWCGILVNQRDNKIVEGTGLITLTNVDLSNVSLSQEQWIKGKVSNGELKLGNFNFRLTQETPGNPGSTPYRLILKNNSYFGVDLDIPIDLEVKNPPPVEKEAEVESDLDSDSDISEPDEDSLAGALAALRGKPVKKIEEVTEVEEEEEENDDDDESIFTDINTDTEDEASLYTK